MDNNYNFIDINETGLTQDELKSRYNNYSHHDSCPTRQGWTRVMLFQKDRVAVEPEGCELVCGHCNSADIEYQGCHGHCLSCGNVWSCGD